jgi:hypothetical protein
MPVSHVSLPTGQKHFAAMRAFYLTILTPLGYLVFMEKENQVIGFGPKTSGPDFWLHCGGTEFEPFDGDVSNRKGHAHVAFEVSSVAKVKEWYGIAM